MIKEDFPVRRGRIRWEWILLAVVLLGCLVGGLWLYRPREGETVAVITVDSVELTRLALGREENRIFSIAQETGRPVSFEILDHRIRFIEVDCPDHVCEKAGFCGAPGERAVCLPNRTTLVCYAAEELSAA